MSEINEIFERLNIQKLREFFLTGMAETDIDNLSYEDRLEIETKPIIARLERLITDEHEFAHASSELDRALYAREDVYMEIGLKAGARLLSELLFTEYNIEIYKK